jgi:hypothetical protein
MPGHLESRETLEVVGARHAQIQRRRCADREIRKR